jgi:hypothetical protein
MAHKQLELQERDIALLETVRDLTVISLNQIQRLFWPEAGREVARKRLSHLMNRGQGWLTNFTVPKPEMQAAGLEPGKIYCLSKNGHSWFRNQGRPPRGQNTTAIQHLPAHESALDGDDDILVTSVCSGWPVKFGCAYSPTIIVWSRASLCPPPNPIFS